ncbi:SLBB domain-containing protein [Thiomicrorhabdus sediminis]|uniref:Protein involved in polysaccharide export, contains SLBB domain of the beta-grasp fold n=1 Tax=Thiomicrorhabdus sediminis TaxID=2580412 RepID=A0A4P9K539_9GAMM|nr:SLBB domain-containing protein [Thiomicrorhabdus sediminis]QCU89550.1 hypothetical protein FE785_02310 [Thiomicrorhabdus sediminis]
MRILLVGFLILVSSWQVQAFTPTEEQIQMFQSLSDKEKQVLIEKYQSGSAISTKQKVERPVDTVIPLSFERAGGDHVNDGAQLQINSKADKEILKSVLKDEHLSESLFSDFNNFAQTKLPPKEKLHPFGYKLFAGMPTTFAPVSSIPVPTDYILGVGDQIKINLFGTKNESYDLVVDRNGQLNIPSLGPVSVAGLSFNEAKVFLTDKLRTLGVGVETSIAMGELRSFRVFVLGESRTPGSYLVSGMATMTHALYVSGGLSDIASYRNIQLKRRGKLIKTLDLYDLMLRGDTSDDTRLQPGDTVFIPRVQKQVSIQGEVLKPALYELKNENSLSSVIGLAGGLSKNGYSKSVTVSRITAPEVRQSFSLDLNADKGKKFHVENGDSITVAKVEGETDDLVKLSGEVSLEGVFAVNSDTKLLDVLSSRKQFTNDADLEAILIKRQTDIAGKYSVQSASWLKAVANPDAKDNIGLAPRDELIVLSKKDAELRKTQVQVVIDALDKQEVLKAPNTKVLVNGPVKFPGSYPLTEGMHVSDLIALGGGLLPSAMLQEVEVVRYQVIDGEKRQIKTLTLNLEKAIAGDEKNNIALQSYDALSIKRVTDWEDASSVVVVKGEVAYPGTYVIKPGDTLENLLTRAGGFTEWAAPQNVVFTRESLKDKERQEMDAMADELEKNLLFSIKQNSGTEGTNANSAQALVALGQSLVQKVKETPAVGRLVVGLNPEELERYHATLQLELRNGDELYIPKRANEIVVMGEVSRPASLLYQKNLSLQDYLKQSGGITKRADDESIYVVRGDGSIVPYEAGAFSLMSNDFVLKPGDTIVVPMDVERMSPLVTWTAVTKILSNLAVTAATLQTLGVIN